MLIAITTNLKNFFKAINPRLISGIGWKLLSCACFAGINIIVRYLSATKTNASQHLPVLVIMFFQNLIGSILLLPLIINKNYAISNLIDPKEWHLQLARIFLTIIGILLWYLSLEKMPVTEVVAISGISPILTLFGAILFLQEKITFKKIIAILCSFSGCILISRPDLSIYHKFYNWLIFLPISSTLIFAIDKVILKKILSQQQCPKITTIYILLFTAPLCLLLAILTHTWVNPIRENMLLLLILGGLTALANVAFNKSLILNELSTMLPYGISKIIFSSILSYMVFREIPRTLDLWVGILIITISTMLLV